MREKVVVFAPHPDDEVLGCGGTIARKSNEGVEVFIVFLTDGRNSLRELGVMHPSPLEVKGIRKEEAKRASSVLGVPNENMVFLDIEDGTLQENERVARGKIAKALRIFPQSVYFPQEKEFHVDHREANYLVRNVIEHMHFRPHQYQYIIAWQYPLNLLPRLRPQHLQNIIISKLLRGNMIFEDISDFLHTKEAALKEYRSQLTIVSYKQRRTALKDSFVKGFLKSQEIFFADR